MKNFTFNYMKASLIKEYKTIGINLKEFRKNRGLSQQELANLCEKVDRAKISDIENAKEDFMLSTLLEICIALNIDIRNLFSDNF